MTCISPLGDKCFLWQSTFNCSCPFFVFIVSLFLTIRLRKGSGNIMMSLNSNNDGLIVRIGPEYGWVTALSAFIYISFRSQLTCSHSSLPYHFISNRPLSAPWSLLLLFFVLPLFFFFSEACRSPVRKCLNLPPRSKSFWFIFLSCRLTLFWTVSF